MKNPSRPRGPTFRSLEIRNFRLFFAGQLVSQIGSWTRMVAATLLVLHLTDSGVAIGVLACQFGPVLILGPWMGVVADRLDKRRLLMALQLAAMAQSILYTILASMESPPLLAICAISLVGGITFALESPVRHAFVVEIVPPELVQNAVGLTGAMMTSARIFGPTVAGLIRDELRLQSVVLHGRCNFVHRSARRPLPHGRVEAPSSRPRDNDARAGDRRLALRPRPH